MTDFPENSPDLLNYLLANHKGPLQIFKDVTFTQSVVNCGAGNFTTNYNETGDSEILQETIRQLLKENQKLREEIKELKAKKQ